MDNDKIFSLLEKIYVELQETKQGVKSNSSRLESLENDVKKIGMKIDSDLIPTDKAILDGYKQNTENINVIDEKIDKLQIDINNLSMKTANNDNRIIELSRNLKKVK